MASRRAHPHDDVLAAIDVGTNAVRLELARVLADGALEPLHTERDPVRPGEGVFTSGYLGDQVVDRLLATLRRYGALCRRHGARVRAVATSALREAKNRDEIVRRVKREAGLSLEVISGREEARLICLGVLHGKPKRQRSLCIDLGGGSTEFIDAQGEVPRALYSVDVGAVRLTELFQLSQDVGKKKLRLVRDYARELMAEALPRRIAGAPSHVIGSSGTIGAVVGFSRSEGVGHATFDEISWAVGELAGMDLDERRKHFDPKRAEVVVAGAVILEAALRHLGVERITAVDQGLREGLLQDLLRRRRPDDDDPSLGEAAVAFGRRLGFGEAHGRQVAKLALGIFDGLAKLHDMPKRARAWLEVAALLHDVGHVVSHQKHHRHSHYLIGNADIPGLSDHERALVALIARFHRRSPPEPNHELLRALEGMDARIVRRCATILRVADSLDRSHHQPVRRLSLQLQKGSVRLHLDASQALDLERWDVEHEAALFHDVFDRRLVIVSKR